MFKAFINAFPPENGMTFESIAEDIERYIAEELSVPIPQVLSMFWREFGAGYYGDRALYFFGSGTKEEPRDSLKEWNGKDFWRTIYPSPIEGGPVFFAETGFGDQLGFRWEAGKCIYILFLVDTFESFVIAGDDAQLFRETLSDRYALVDRGRYESVRARLGPLQTGMHYAPILSPLLGGGGEPENFAFETPKVHFATAVYAYATGKPLRIEV